MMTTKVDQAKEIISAMTLEERAELNAWFHGWEDDDWDRQMKRDVADGKLDHLLAEVDADIKAGRIFDMP